MDTMENMTDEHYIDKIYEHDQELKSKYVDKMCINDSLNRKVVSFQANKKVPFFRWFKYKEGFSSNLVSKYILDNNEKPIIKILDPFAGSGSTLFVASDLGIDSVGIELLPIGQELIKTRNILINDCTTSDFERIKYWFTEKPWVNFHNKMEFNVLNITNGAYPENTLNLIKQYLSCLTNENSKLQEVLRMALFCVLENISYTRKDGQYLRWDYRSGRKGGAIPFDKGIIKEFNEAIVEKIKEIYEDSVGLSTELFPVQKNSNKKGSIEVIGGSCLIELQNISDNSVNFTITSPPYCNRYDYTRTYALELAMLGVDEKKLVELRQEMLSCTVENRAKDLIAICKDWSSPLSVVEDHILLQEIINYLEHKKKNKTLNNNGLPRMVKGYFYEMACVIYELYRVTSPGGKVIMVNDNVRYAGASVSVDLILSDIAKSLGFNVDKIEILPIGKGNSSQQMGEHGRDALRKCVYTWSKK